MPFHFKGETVAQVPVSEMSPGEIDHVEKITGLSYARLERLAKTCVCEHNVARHLHFEGDKPTDQTNCKDCDCESFASDQPVRATFAYLWIALKRVKPEITFEDVENTPQSEWRYEGAKDPTPPPPPSQTE